MLSLGNKLSLTTQPIYKFVNEHSVVFDGTDEYINVNTLAGTMSTGQAFSISVWFKATGSVGGHSTMIFSAHNSGGSNIYRLGLKNSGGIFYAAAVSDTVVGSTDYFDSEWHHLVVTRSTGSSTSTFYVDGVSIGTIANTNPVWDNATQYSIGQEFDGTQATDEFVGNIDELALYDRELTQAEVTRMYNTYYSPNRIANGNFSQIGNEEVTNGDFSQIGSEEVTNGDFSQIGSEQVTNGDFATDSDWTKGSNITISGGSAIFNNAVPYNNLSQNSIFQTGKTYKIEFSVSNFSGGRLIVQESPNVNPPIQEVESNGNYSVFYTATTNSGIVFKVVNGTVNMNLDNVSVKEVGQDWTLTDVDFALGAVSFDGGVENIFQNFSDTLGSFYKVETTGTGTLRFRHGYAGSAGTYIDITVGTDFYFQSTSDTNRLQFYVSNPASSATLNSVSVKEVGQDWTVAGTDSTHFVQFTSTGARFVSDTTSPVLELKQTALTSGKNYVLTCNVAYAAGSGAIRFWVGTNQTALTEGANTKYFTASSTTLSFLRNEADVDCVISNVSVKEVGQHWTVASFDADNYMEFNGSTARVKFLNTSPVTTFTGSFLMLADTTYKLIVDIASVTSGSIKVDGAGISELFNSAGVTTRTITPTVNTGLTFYRASADVDLTLNSVVLQELKHDATNLMLNAGDYQSANPLITSTKSMEFDGIDDYMEVQDDSSLQLEGSEASWTFWTRLDSLSGGDQKFFAKSISGTDTNAYQLRTDNANLLFQFFSGSWRTATSSSFFTDLNWVNVTVTIDASNIVRIYKNGVETHNSNIGYSIPANTGEMLFGARTPSSPTNFLNGEMTEVGIYNRCLTALEVASLYNQGMPTNLLVNRNNYQSGNPTVFNTKQVDFDGVDDVLNIGNPSVLNFTSDFTISMWIKSNVNTDSYNGLFTKYGGSAGWDLILSSGKVRMALRGTSAIDTGGGSGSDLRDGNWHHIVAVNTNSDIKLYLDGVLIQTQTGTWTPTTTTNDALIGERGGIPNFDGDISQVGVWTGTLTADEVSSLYNHKLPIDLTTDQAAYASSSNLVGYWRMGSGTLDSYPLIADQTNATLSAEYAVNGDFSQIGSEEVTNGDFASATGWNTSGGGTISDGKAYIVGDGSAFTNISQSGVFTSGKQYKVTVDVTINSGLGLKFQDGANNENIGFATTSGSYTFYFASTSNTTLVIGRRTGGTAFNSSIDNISVKEMAQGWTAPTQDGAYQQLTADGLKMYAGTAAGGSNLLSTSPTFNLSGTEGKVYKADIVCSDFVAPLGSSMFIRLNGAYDASNIISFGVGTSTIYFTAYQDFTFIRFFAGSFEQGFTLKSISIKEVGGNPAIMTNQTSTDIENGSPYANLLQNGDFSDGSTGWAGDDATLDVSSNTGKVTVTSNTEAGIKTSGVNFLTQNKKYRLTFDVVNATGGLVSGTIKEYSSSNIAGSWDGVGSYSIDFTYLSSSSQLRWLSTSSIGDILEIDNVTISEVNTGLQGYWKMGDGTNDEYPVIFDQTDPTLGSELVTNGDFATDSDWNKGSNWTIANGLATRTSGVTSNLSQVISDISGKTLKVSYTVSNYGNGNIGASYNGSDFNGNTGNGTFTDYITPTSNNLYIRASYSFSGSIDNVSVKIVQGNPATMTNMVEGNITNQYPLTKIRNYYRMGDGILDGYPIIQDQTSPNLAHIPTTNIVPNSNTFNVINSATATPNYGISPDGTQNSVRIQTSGNNSGVLESLSNTLKDTDFTYSVFLKGVAGETIDVRIETSPYSLLSQIQHTFSGEWERVEKTVSASITHTTKQYYITHIGAATATDFQIFGMQVEQQSQATAYLKSDGIAAVRKLSTTNLLPYSEDFSQSEWIKLGAGTGSTAVVTSNYAISPDGTQNATRLQCDLNGGGTSSSNQSLIYDLYTSSGAQSISIYVKSNTGSNQTIYFANTQTTGDTITVTNEWQRFEFNHSSSITFILAIGLRGRSGGAIDDTADVLIWGAQAEQQTQAETYAKTTGLPVTIDLFTENNYGTMTNMSASDIVEDTP